MSRINQLVASFREAMVKEGVAQDAIATARAQLEEVAKAHPAVMKAMDDLRNAESYYDECKSLAKDARNEITTALTCEEELKDLPKGVRQTRQTRLDYDDATVKNWAIQYNMTNLITVDVKALKDVFKSDEAISALNAPIRLESSFKAWISDKQILESE